MRDPYLVRSPEGDTVYLIATELSIHNRGGWGAATATTNGSTNLIVWESHDFVNWSEPRAVDVASQIPGAGMAWAPEAYWDDVNKSTWCTGPLLPTRTTSPAIAPICTTPPRVIS